MQKVGINNISTNQAFELKGLFPEGDTTALENYIAKIQEVTVATEAMRAQSSLGLADDIGQYQMYADALAELEPTQAAVLLSTQGLTNEQIRQTLACMENTTTHQALTAAEQYQAMADAGLLSSKQTLTAAEAENTLQTILGNDARAQEVLASIQVTTSTNAEGVAVTELSGEKLAAAVSSGKLTEAEAKEFAVRTNLAMVTGGSLLTSLKNYVTQLLNTAKATAMVSMKTLAMNAPMLVASTVVLGLITVYRSYQQRLEETRQAAESASQTFQDSSSSLADYTSKYEELHQKLIAAKGDEEATYEIKQQLLELQKELNDKYGEEVGRIDLVTDAYKNQTRVLKGLNKELADNYLSENRSGISQAKNKMTKTKTYTLGTNVNADANSGALRKVVQKYLDRGVRFEQNSYSDDPFSYSIKVDVQDAEEAKKVITDFMNDLRDAGRELGNEDLFGSILNKSEKSLKKASSIVEKYGETYRESRIAEIVSDNDAGGKAEQFDKVTQAVQKYNDAVARSEDPFNDKDVQAARKELSDLKSDMQNADGTWNAQWAKYGDLADEAFSEANTAQYDFYNEMKNTDAYKTAEEQLKGLTDVEAEALLNAKDNLPGAKKNALSKLEEGAKEAGLSTQGLIEMLQKLGVIEKTVQKSSEAVTEPFGKTEMIAEINSLSEGFEELDKIMASMKDKNKAFDFSLLDDKKFHDNFGQLGQEYENFVTAISNSPKDVNACQDAFDALVTKWVESKGVLSKVTEETAGLTAAMLSNMGVANASEVVVEALARNAAQAEAAAIEEKYLTDRGKELTDQTWDEISAFTSQNQASQLAQQELAKLKLAKLDLNKNQINLDTDISAILTIASAANVAAKQLSMLSTLDSLQQRIKSGNATPGELSMYDELSGKLSNDTSWIQGEPIHFEPVHYSGGNKTADKSNGSSNKDSQEPTEFDWIERKLNTVNEKIETTQDNIENLVGYKAKNAETDTALDLMAQKLEILQQMSDEYMKSANEIGLSEDYINRIKNGDDFVEEIGDKEIADKVKKYQDLYDKAQDCTKQITELNKTIKETGLSKLDNIINQYDQLNDTLSKPLDTQLQILDWHKASGTMDVVADDYIALGEIQKQIAQNSREEYDRLAEEMKKLNLKKDSEEWKKYNDQLIQCKQNMVSAAQAVEDYKDQMKELVYKELTDYKSKMDSINNTISTMSDLIGDTKLVDETGKLTDRGLAQMALYAQQLANAKQEAAEYDEAIKSLEDALDSGLITQDEYNEMLSDYRSSQESAVSATKDARDAIISLAKEGIQAEIDARKEQTDAAIEALEAEKDLHDYTESINEKQKNITTLQKKIAALSGATSGAELAQRLQLEKDLADAQKDLYDTQYDHNIEKQKDALNDAYDAYEKEKNDEMDELDSNLDAQEKAINKYLSEVKANYKTAYKVLTQYGDEYNLSATEDLTTPWESGSSAANLCADAIGDAVANINYEISNIDISPLEELISAMQQLADYGISGSGDGTQSFEDVTDQGTWHEGSGGRYWYGSSNDEYVSGGIYTIKGKQYGFGDDGYMFEGWNDEYDGNWRYFQKGDGYMVKSDWVKDKGKWYYLDKNGAMLTDAVVKDKSDSDKYYYVNEDGVYDGKEFTYDQVKAMGLKVGYRTGTKSATPGFKPFDEDGRGSEIIITDDGTMLRDFSAGDMVLNKDMANNLWDIAKNPNMYTDGLKNNIATDIPMVNNQMQQVINIPINIEGNADEKTINTIKEWVPQAMKKYATGKMWNDISTAGIRYRR